MNETGLREQMEFNMQIAEKYLNAFGSKDIDKLSDLYSDDVTLRDWETTITGKDNLLKANKDFFDTVQNLDVVVGGLCINHATIAAEIIIHIDDESLLVTDIITVNGQGYISSIRAYKG